MSWKETSKGHFTAPLGGLESFFVLLCAPDSGREHWTVGLDATLDVTQLVLGDGETLESRLRDAWLTLRFEHPALAVELDAGSQSKTYHVTDEAGARQWATSTFEVHEDHTTTLDNVITGFSAQRYPRLHWLPHSNQILFQISHWRIDGRGILFLMNGFLDLFVSPNLSPSNLTWGKEAENLTLSFEAANDVPVEPSKFAEAYAQKQLQDLINGFPATGLAFKGDLQTKPQASHRSALIFTPQSSKALFDVCHQRGLSITSACEAAVAYTTIKLAPPERQNMSFTTLLGIDMRNHCPPPLNSARYAVNNYVAGQYLFISKDEMTGFDDVARKIDFQIHKKFVPAEYIESVRAICTTLTPLLTNPPPSELPPVSEMPISSLGIVEKYIKHEYAGHENGSIVVRNVKLGIEMGTRQIALHLWTWHSKFHISASYNEAYHDEAVVRQALLSMKTELERGLGVSLELEQP